MPFNYPQAGFNSVAEYQASGLPWATSTTLTGDLEVNFPMVSRSVTIMNATGGGDLKIAFTRTGMSSSNYVTLKAGSTFKEEIRVAKLFLNGTASVISIFGSLTGISSGSCPVLTSSMYGGI